MAYVFSAFLKIETFFLRQIFFGIVFEGQEVDSICDKLKRLDPIIFFSSS